MSALPTHITSGATPACSQANSAPAGAPEAGRDLVEHEQQPVLVAQPAQQRDALRRVEAHPPRPLHDGLDDHRGQLVRRAGRRSSRDVRRPARVQARVEAVGRALGEHVLGEHAGEHAVHPADRVADGHRAERVAVVAAAHGQQPRALGLAARALKLQAQLDRDLDGDRAGVGEEHPSSPSGASSTRRSARRTAGSCVSPPNITCAIRPSCSRAARVERGVAVAVDRAPPRGHAVDQLAAVRQLQAHALRRDDRQRRLRAGQRAVGMPDVLAVEREQCVPVGSDRVLILVGTKSRLRAPHTGQNQVSGMSSKAVPGGNAPVRVALLGVVDVAAGLADPALQGLGRAHARKTTWPVGSLGVSDSTPGGDGEPGQELDLDRHSGPGQELNLGRGHTPPRQAATVILLRGGAQTLEVLLVKRTPEARFMGGVWVFPGGAVDAGEGEGDERSPRGGDPRAARGGRDRARGPGRAREVLALDHPGRGAHALRHALLPRLAARRPGAAGGRRGVRRARLVHARGGAAGPPRRRDRARVPHDQAPRTARRLRLRRGAARATRAGARCSRSSRGWWSRARSPACCCRAMPRLPS